MMPNNDVSVVYIKQTNTQSAKEAIYAYALQKISTRLHFAEKIARIGYWEFSLETGKIHWSKELYNILGIIPPKPSSLWHIIRKFIFKQDIPNYVKQLKKLLKTEESADGLFRIKKSDGSLIYCNYKTAIIHDNGEKKIAGILQDMTEQISTQNALERANLEKSYFLAQASHDLRQPMVALDMFISLLAQDNLSIKQADILNKIKSSSDNLKNLLDNFLDISKLDSGGLKYEPQNFHIGVLLQDLAEEYQQIAVIKGIKFHTLVKAGVVRSDPILVERILRNLLSNAFKYTTNKIVLGCKRAGNNYRVMIIDNGPGISETEQKNIFQNFYQSDQNTFTKKSGAGLGLSIVKKISRLIGTKININSIPGRGTCFSFLLPKSKD